MWSGLYPGNRHTVRCLQPAVLGAENALELALKQRRRTVWRLDGGAGSDDQIRWLLDRGYHVLAKGISNRRAGALAKQVTRWDAYNDYWLGEVDSPDKFSRPVHVFVRRRSKKGKMVHSYYVTTLSLPSKGQFATCYDARGGAEVEQFRSDKQALSLAARRKQGFLAQTAFILLTDLAHNLLADFYHQALIGTRFESFGLRRIVRDLIAVPGRLAFRSGELKRVELLTQKQFAADLVSCLVRYCLGN